MAGRASLSTSCRAVLRAAALAVALAACAQPAARSGGAIAGGSGSQRFDVRPGEPFEPASDRPKLADAAQRIAGVWMRPIRGAEAPGREGLAFRPDGSFGLVGVHSMNGLGWRVEGDAVQVTTNTQRYPSAEEQRLRILELDAERLVLGGASADDDGGYLAGSYQRDDDAAGWLQGSVGYRERVTLPADASVHLALREIGGHGSPPRLVASQTLPTEGRQVPISFWLVYAVADVDPERLYVLDARIAAGGEPRFESVAPAPVVTLGHPREIELRVRPVPAR